MGSVQQSSLLPQRERVKPRLSDEKGRLKPCFHSLSYLAAALGGPFPPQLFAAQLREQKATWGWAGRT